MSQDEWDLEHFLRVEHSRSKQKYFTKYFKNLWNILRCLKKKKVSCMQPCTSTGINLYLDVTRHLRYPLPKVFVFSFLLYRDLMYNNIQGIEEFTFESLASLQYLYVISISFTLLDVYIRGQGIFSNICHLICTNVYETSTRQYLESNKLRSIKRSSINTDRK